MSNTARPPSHWIPDHIKQYLSDPEKAHLWDSSVVGYKGMIKTLLLTTKGRKTGKTIYSPLIYSKTGDSFVVIGSKGGALVHPHWYSNLMAADAAEIQVGAQHFHVRPRVATGAERAKLWTQMTQIYAPYDDYKKNAGTREIPVVVLERVT